MVTSRHIKPIALKLHNVKKSQKQFRFFIKICQFLLKKPQINLVLHKIFGLFK